MKQAVKPDISRFQHWESPLLRELLVNHDVEVRGANRAPHDFLVGVCDDVFKDKVSGGRRLRDFFFGIESVR